VSNRPFLLLAAACFIAGLAVAAPARCEVTLQVTPVEGAELRDLDFGDAQSIRLSGEAPSNTVIRRVKLTINSNSSGRYQIFQQVNSPWINTLGTELPLPAVKFFVSESTPQGDVRFPSPTPLILGEQDLYISPSGGNRELLVTYTVQVPTGQTAGTYHTTITYRVVSQ